MKRLVLAGVLLGACASNPAPSPTPVSAPEPRAVSEPAPVSVPAPVAEPAPEPEPEPEPVAAPEPEPEPDLPAKTLCNRAEVNLVLKDLPKDLENPQLGHVKLSDLEVAPTTNEQEPGDGFGVFGARDLDQNGKGDRVLLYTSVDYWLWLLFRNNGGCQQFLGAVPGYKLTIEKTAHNGIRDIVALSYPIQGQDERYEFDGKKYQKR